MSYSGGTLVVTASGRTRPDSGAALSEVLRQQFGSNIPISLVWTKTPVLSPSSTPSASTDSTVDIARSTSDAWIVSHPGTEILGIDQNVNGLTVTLIGGVEPSVGDLEQQLQAALPRLVITIEWVNGTVLGQITSSPTPPVSLLVAPSPLPTVGSSN
jgi:hypothetical protein